MILYMTATREFNTSLPLDQRDTASAALIKLYLTPFFKGDTGGAATLDELTDVDLTTNPPVNGQSLVYNSGTGEWEAGTVSSGDGVTDHGLLSGLADDDHTQYLNNTRGDARYYPQNDVDTALALKEGAFTKNTGFNKDFGTTAGTVTQGNDVRLSDTRTPTSHTHVKADVTDFSEGDYATAAQGALADTALQSIGSVALADLSNVASTAPNDGEVLTFDTINGWQPETIPSGVTDHGLLSGLTDDDHVQYHTDARGDVRYYTKTAADTLLDAKQATITPATGFNLALGTTAGTVTEGNDPRLSDARTPTAHTHIKSEITDFSDGDYATAAQGAKADTALQSLPAHTHIKANITDFVEGDYATAAQGAKADTALQDITSQVLSNLSNVAVTVPTDGQVLTFDTINGWQPETNLSGVTDHGALSGLGDDDHTQYLNNARGDTRYAQLSGATLTGFMTLHADPTATGHAANKGYVDAEISTAVIEAGGGVTDHGLLSGLADDDHVQYHTDARGDVRYYTQAAADILLAAKELAFTKNTGFNKDFGTIGGTVTQGNDARLSDARTPTAHTHVKADVTDFSDGDYATAAQGALADSALQDIASQALANLSNVSAAIPVNGEVLTFSPANGWEPQPSASGVTDHGLLSGLADDDHVQYHTDARGDVRYYTQAAADTLLDAKEPTFTKNTGFNKDFGTTVGTVTQGNDARLSDARTPTAHTHVKADVTDFSDGDYATAAQGALAATALQDIASQALNNLSDVEAPSPTNGQVLTYQPGVGWQPETSPAGVTDHGLLAGLVDDDHTQYHTDARGDARYYTQTAADSLLSAKEPTFTKNTGFNKDFGTTVGTVTQGNDARLSDARTPTSHTHVKADVTDFSEGDYATAAQGALADTALQSITSQVLANLSNVASTAPSDGQVLTFDTTNGWQPETSASGVTDHGLLSGLADDDHTQYHTDARGDARYYTQTAADSLLNAKEPTFTKNTGFNKDFGTTVGTVTQGNDARLSDARTPTAHTHVKADVTDFSEGDYATAAQGALADTALQDIASQVLANLSNVASTAPSDGQVLTFDTTNGWQPETSPAGVTDHGALSGLADDDHVQYHTDARGDARYYTQTAADSLLNAKEPTFTKNTGFNKDFGTTVGTVTQGNDARLSDARTPTAHTHVKANITDFVEGDYATAAHTHVKANITDFSDGDYATAAQGTTADTALQPVDVGALAALSTVGTAQIDNSAVTYAKLQNMAANTLLGNNTGGSAVAGALTASQVRTLLALVVGTNVQAYNAALTGTTGTYTSANATKLSGIATAATANATDAALRDRTTHTGTQALSTISDVPANPIAAKSFWTGTQAAYGGLTPDANTIYYIQA